MSRPAAFRPSRVPDTGLASDISVEALLAEMTRRQRVLAQLSAVLTADTALARNPQIHPESIRVSALQWSLLIRVRHGTTPRDLAWNLSRGVFGTTVEVNAGVKEGDQVILNPPVDLTDGRKVQIRPAPPAQLS